MKPMSILLVEDDQETCEIFKEYIESRNDITLAGMTNSSYEALEIVKCNSIDVVILDLYLKNRYGFWESFFKKSR